MPSPFPGMDPYLEQADAWHPFHTFMVAELARHCASLLPPDYYVSVESRTYVVLGDDPEEVQVPEALLVGGISPSHARLSPGVTRLPPSVLAPPHGTLEQRYLEIRSRHPGDRAITVLEVLSPSNKCYVVGRDDYVNRRGRVLFSRTHLVEIDLLRTGPKLAALGAPDGADYGVLISRAPMRPRAQFIPFTVRDPLPEFPLPLSPEDPEPLISLAQVLESVYAIGRYDLQIDYSRDPEPPLKPEDAAWADRLLRECGLR